MEIEVMNDIDYDSYHTSYLQRKMAQAKPEAWYYTKDINNEYYSPFAKKKDVYSYIGDGEKLPLPKDIVSHLNKNPNLYYDESGYFNTKEELEDTKVTAVPLPPGVYRYAGWENGDLPPRLLPFELREDKYIELEGVFKDIEADISTFLKNEDFYRKKNLMYKRGILLYGAPGGGKTVFIRKTIEKLIPKDSVVIFMNSLPDMVFINKMKNSLKDRVKVFVFEELTTACEREAETERLLNFLDGENSIDKCIILATTNYPEKLPGNIVDRPSRFDQLFPVEEFDDKVLIQLLKFYLDLEDDPTPAQLKGVKSLTIAAIKELALLMQLHEKTFEEALDMMKARKKLVKNAFCKPLGSGETGFSLCSK